MAGSVDLHLNIQNGLDESLNKSTKSLGQMDNIADKIDNTMKQVVSNSDDLNNDFEEIAESAKKTNGFTDKLKSGMSKIAGQAKRFAGYFAGGAVIFGMADLVQDTLSLNQQMSDLSYRMGEAGVSAKQLEGATLDVMGATGASSEASMEWIKELRQLRVATKDVTALGTAGVQFTKITGASAGAVQQLVGKLTTVGKIGPSGIKDMLNQVANVQRAFGLTAQEVDGLTETITKSTQYLRQMGKTTAEVIKFNTGVCR